MDSKDEKKKNDFESDDMTGIPVIPDTPESVKRALELSEYIQEVKKTEGDIDNIGFDKIEDNSDTQEDETVFSDNEQSSEASVHQTDSAEDLQAQQAEPEQNTTSSSDMVLDPPESKKQPQNVAFLRVKKFGYAAVSVIWNIIRCLLTGIFRTTKFMVYLVTVLLIVCVIGGSILFVRYHALYTSIRQTEYDRIANLSEETFTNLNNTRIYDDKDHLLAEITSADYEYVEINNVSRYIQEGYIAVEDKNFKEHFGVDPTAIGRAAVALVKNNGAITQGGSTITQQVVKNTLLTSEQTYVRKCAEILLAIDMEKKFTKAQIMEFYVNSNFYGNQCYGVEAACQYYFGKSAADVSISEAAMIVGMSNSPSKYNPVANYDLAIQKRNSVLKKMLKHNVITSEEYDEALNDSMMVVEKRTESLNETYQVSYAIYSAVITLMEQDGFEFQYLFDSKEEYDEYRERYSEAYSEMSEYVRSGGFDIYTSLNNKQQKMLQRSVDGVLSGFTEKQSDNRYAVQGAAVCVDNETGYVTAIVGGRGKKDQYNRAYLAKRQPGSTIKPLLDYAPAFETGEYYPSKIMNDHAIANGPKNSGGSYRGNIAMREAIARSLNTIAFQTLQGIGVSTGLKYLEQLRFNSLSYVDNNNLVISIGGFTNGVRVVDMAKGYSTLASGGVYIERSCIRKIKQQGEGLVYTDTKTSHQVYLEDTAWLMTDCLKGTMELPYGTGHGCTLENQICAGKTGTTNDSKDGWFCGYTTSYSTAVWVGRDDNKSITGMYGATYAGKIWQQYMNELHKGKAKEDFIKPETVKKKSVDSSGLPTNVNTGKQDFFSLYAENKRSLLEQKREEEKAEKNAEKKVQTFEKFQIEKVEDCYLIEKKYEKALASITAVQNTDIRIQLSTRVADKYAELEKEKENWTDIMAAYEIEQARKEEEAKKKAEAEALAAQAAQQKTLTISRFHNALKIVQDTTEEVTDYTYTMLDLASQYLTECAEYQEYDTLLQEYNTEKERIEELKKQNEQTAAAQASAANAASQAKADRIRRDRERVANEATEQH